MAKLKIGDVVVLKSGGSTMTVEKIKKGKAHCVWFGVRYELARDVFPVNSIELFELHDSSKITRVSF